MLATLWSTKGGSGTSVIAAAMAARLGRRKAPAFLIDLDGSAADVMAVDLDGPGVADWLKADDTAPIDVLDRLGVGVTDELRVVPRGEGHLDRDRAELFAQLVAADERDVVVDCGTVHREGSAVARSLYDHATNAILVVRPCYLALRRAQSSRWSPSEVVVVREPGRSLNRRDIEQVLGVPVRAEVPFDASVSRAVDAGLLVRRPPRLLDRALGKIAS